MATAAFSFTPPSGCHDPAQDLEALSEQTSRIIAIAHAMVTSRRPVDLQGLQDQVGLLCAKALDLPPERTGFAKLELSRLAADLDALQEALRLESP